ncbi:G-protein coupled receptor 161-like [Nothobranchius furzeri]|uniref:G-protein coupled receptor 161-like n=1 Tax=Nothobranchius furzeri TaxID=105023 RepID=A0A9D2YID8_NOTFU|nr:G-protein coupled receptor 161-like [Nothobranchius furzeri]
MEDQDGSGSPLRAAAVNMSRVEVEAGEVSGWSQPLLEVLMVLMCLGAVIGNVLVIVTVAATKTLRVVTSVLIMNLALSDLLVGVGVMPFIALSIMNHRWVQCTRLCLCIGYTSSVFCTASVLTLAAIALDRYHSIMDCLRYSSRCTLWKLCAVVLWIWLLALASCSPPLMGWSSISYVVPMYICAIDWAHSSSYTLFMAALTYFVPASVIIFCYVNIVKVALSHARRIHSLEDSVQRSRNSSQKREIIVLFFLETLHNRATGLPDRYMLTLTHSHLYRTHSTITERCAFSSSFQRSSSVGPPT